MKPETFICTQCNIEKPMHGNGCGTGYGVNGLRKVRGGSKIYYDREKHNAAMKEHRKYKHKTLK